MELSGDVHLHLIDHMYDRTYLVQNVSRDLAPPLRILGLFFNAFEMFAELHIIYWRFASWRLCGPRSPFQNLYIVCDFLQKDCLLKLIVKSYLLEVVAFSSEYLFDIYWLEHSNLVLRQEEINFFGRIDSVIEEDAGLTVPSTLSDVGLSGVFDNL